MRRVLWATPTPASRRRPNGRDPRTRFYLHTVDGVTGTNNQGPTEPMLLTVPEACVLLRISRWGLYRLIHSRSLRTIQIGSRRLIPREAVVELIEKLGQEANS